MTGERICQHDECCDYRLCAHPKCCGYLVGSASATGETTDAGEGEALTDDECAELSAVVGRLVRPHGYVAVTVERIVAARVSAAATRAADARAERIARACEDEAARADYGIAEAAFIDAARIARTTP